MDPETWSRRSTGTADLLIMNRIAFDEMFAFDLTIGLFTDTRIIRGKQTGMFSDRIGQF